MLKHKSVLRDAEKRAAEKEKHTRWTTKKKSKIFANTRGKRSKQETRREEMKNLHFFRETSRDFVGALCAFSILFPTIRQIWNQHTQAEVEQRRPHYDSNIYWWSVDGLHSN